MEVSVCLFSIHITNFPFLSILDAKLIPARNPRFISAGNSSQLCRDVTAGSSSA
jgi:hypothetical protein